MALFKERREAGRQLATKLSQYANRPDVLVLGLPRGGVPVAYEVARALNVPLDVFIVRKLGVPRHEELAMGALASGGLRVLNRDVVDALQIPPAVIEAVVANEQQELERRNQLYRGGRPMPSVRGRTVILIDDGLATGASMRAAVEALRQAQPAKIVVAVPVAAAATCDEFLHEVDEIVCLSTPEPFYAVGAWYADFSQTSDDEVRELLEDASRGRPVAGASHDRAVSRTIRIAADQAQLDGDLDVPEGAQGIVLFAHGSGSSRHSPRNRYVAEFLRQRGLGTLLLDLLTPEEESADRRTGHLRFDISLLAHRLVAATDWLLTNPETRGLRIGYFGASTGAAAALVAAAQRPQEVAAIVSRGGRPDLAGPWLAHVEAPTLLIVGERDEVVIELNNQAFEQLSRAQDRKLVIVPGATHLFEEPGALEEVAQLAAEWFSHYLQPQEAPSAVRQ